MLTFAITTPPGKNALFRNVSEAERERCRALGKRLPRGRRRTHEYNRWRNVAEWDMRLDGNKTRTWEPFTGPVAVELIVSSRHDNDALVPAIFDLFTTMRVWLDDSQVKKHLVEYSDADSRRVIVSVRPLTESPGRRDDRRAA